VKGMKTETQAKELDRNYGEKMKRNEEKYSIHITTEETNLELFVCENVIINIAVNYVNS
jgi:diphthamide synthase (EF-2-diphthine--ammonia ligase)